MSSTGCVYMQSAPRLGSKGGWRNLALLYLNYSFRHSMLTGCVVMLSIPGVGLREWLRKPLVCLYLNHAA